MARTSPPANTPDTVRPWTQSERMRVAIVYWVIVVACLVFAAGGLYLIRLQTAPLRSSQPVPATIEHVEIIAKADGHGHITKQPLVIYSYTVAGVRYTTDRVIWLNRSRTDAWAREVTNRYHTGQAVIAYYNPAEPGSAFLERSADWRRYAFAAVPLVLALGLIVYWPRVLKEDSGSGGR